MKKFLISVLLCTVTLLQADFRPEPFSVSLPKTDGKSVLLDNIDVPAGTTGIVLHTFDNSHKTIVAEAVVAGEKNGKHEIIFREFKRLRQAALPEYKLSPQKGDTLILNYLYNRVLPITPDTEHFKAFQQKYGTSFEIIHPDLFASQLYLDHEPKPGKESFREICYQQDTSLLYFAIQDQGYFVDCNTFSILKEEPLATAIDSKNAAKPFYNRIPEIKNRLGGIVGGESIGDYNLYYKKLLGIK